MKMCVAYSRKAGTTAVPLITNGEEKRRRKKKDRRNHRAKI